MPIQRIPLSQPIETRDGFLNTDSKCVNGYFEMTNGKREFVKRPGLTEVVTTPTLPVAQGQGLSYFNGFLFAAINNVLYKIDPTTYAVTTIGTMTGTIGGKIQQCYFNQTLNNTYLFVQNQVHGYTYNPATGAFIQLKDDNVVSVVVETGGQAYTNPSVTFSAPAGGGTTATGTVVTTGSSVTSIAINIGGSGYTSTPTVVIGTLWTTGATVTVGQQVYYGSNLYTYTVSGVTGATAPTFTSGTATDGTATIAYSGTVATAVATISNGVVNSITMSNEGSGYNAAPIISFTGGGGTGTTATATWQGGVVTGVTITNGGSGYTSTDTIVLTFTDNTGSGAAALASLNGFPTGQLVAGAPYLDTYTVIGGTNGEIFTSDPDDPTSWNALNYITAESDPDNQVGLCKHLNYILSFGQYSVEFFYDAGNYPGSPLSVASSYKIELGCANGNSIVSIENVVFFVGTSQDLGPSVYAISGTSPSKISTPFIDRIIQNSTLTDVKAYPLRINGHTFYILTLADLNVTIVYDANEKVWTQWTMWAKGGVDSGVLNVYAEQYFRPSFYAGNGSIYYVLDDDNGKLYTVSDHVYNDAGAPIYYRSVTDLLDSGTTKRKFYQRVEIVGDKQPAIMNIRHTDDDYKSWSPYRTVNLAAQRPQIYQTGQARRRAWEFLCTDNTPLRLLAAEVDFSIGELEQDGPQQMQYRN